MSLSSSSAPRVTLRPVDAEGLAAYVETAADNLARELSRAMALPLEVAAARARGMVSELIPGSDPADLRDGVFLCDVVDASGDASGAAVGTVLGAVLFGHPEADPGRYYVWDIVIEPACRGRGYGRAAMEAIERHGRERGATVIELNVFSGNAGARRLYESLGYETAAIRMLKRL